MKRRKQKNDGHTKEFKYRYDEESGVFIRDSEIGVNWLLNGVLQGEGFQITKVSNEEIQKFLYLLDNSDLRMPDGTHSLVWLKEKLKERFAMAGAKQGQVWDDIASRYRYILEMIDFTIVNTENEDLMEIKKEEMLVKPYRTPNNMEAYFEPKEPCD